MNRLIIRPDGGLCNRLNVVLTAHVIADFFEKDEVYVYWGPGPLFSDDPFESLFDYAIYSITEEEYYYLEKLGFQIHNVVEFTESGNAFFNQSFSMRDKQDLIYAGWRSLEQLLPPNDLHDLYSSEIPYDFKIQRELKSIRPSKKVQNIIETVAPFPKNKTIGIHIRRGDAVKDASAHQFLKSEDYHFDNFIKNTLDKDESIKFFLATDEKTVLDNFIKKYKESIIYLPKDFVESVSHKPKYGQLDAAAELFLLAKTKQIIGTFFSTYSQTAAKIGDIPLTCPTKKETSNISIVTGCMNRTPRLLKTLPSWLKCPMVDDVVIIDWSSDESLVSLAEDFNDSRIRVIRVEGETRWSSSLAFNLAVISARNEIVLKLDIDYILHDNFFETHPMSMGNFYSGDWSYGRNITERFLMGLCYVFKKDFLEINGYNEKILNYGYEDNDLYERLIKIGVNQTICNFNTVSHIPHGDPLRIKYQPEVESVVKSVEQMRDIAHAKVWTKGDKRSEYKIKYQLPPNKFSRAFIYERIKTVETVESEIKIRSGSRKILI